MPPIRDIIKSAYLGSILKQEILGIAKAQHPDV